MNKISYLFISLIVLISFDYLTTYTALSNYGAIELNPIYKLCNSVDMFFIIKTLATITGLYVLYHYRNTLKDHVCKTLVVLNCIYGVVILSNINQIYHYFI